MLTWVRQLTLLLQFLADQLVLLFSKLKYFHGFTDVHGLATARPVGTHSQSEFALRPVLSLGDISLIPMNMALFNPFLAVLAMTP